MRQIFFLLCLALLMPQDAEADRYDCFKAVKCHLTVQTAVSLAKAMKDNGYAVSRRRGYILDKSLEESDFQMFIACLEFPEEIEAARGEYNPGEWIRQLVG